MTVLNRSKLSQLVSNVLPFTATSAFLPILTHIALKDGKISAFNDMQGIEIETDALSELCCAVPGAAFLKIIKTINTEELDLTTDVNKHSLTIKFGKNKTKLAILPDDDFIYSFPEIEHAETLKISTVFLEAAKLCLASVSEVPGHPELNTLTIIIDGKNIELYATDNKTMSRVTFTEEEAQGNVKLVVPAQFFAQLLDLSESTSTEDGITIKYNEELLSVDFNNGTRISTVVVKITSMIDFKEFFESEIPDMERLLLCEVPLGFVNALERASVFSELKNQKFVNIEVKEQALYLRSHSALGKADDIIEFPEDLGSFSFDVNPDTLAKAIVRTNELAILPNLIIAYRKTKNLEFTHLVSFAN